MIKKCQKSYEIGNNNHQGWESVFWLVGATAPTPPLSRPGGLPKVQKVGFPQIPIIPANYKNSKSGFSTNTNNSCELQVSKIQRFLGFREDNIIFS